VRKRDGLSWDNVVRLLLQKQKTPREFIIQGVASGCSVMFQFALWVAIVNGCAASALIYGNSNMPATSASGASVFRV
jgi:hypothetical protein